MIIEAVAAGSLRGAISRSVTGRTSTTPAEDGAWKVLTMQIAISGHWSQSMGADLSGQHGMSADISTISAAAPFAAFAGADSGPNTSPAIKKIASSRPRWIEMFTPLFSHDPAGMKTSAGSLNRRKSAMNALIWRKWSIIRPG